MGSALAVPAAVANQVTLIGSPLDDGIIRSLQHSGHHPTLNVDLPGSIAAKFSSDSNEAIFQRADVIVLGVSSPGVEWALNELKRYECKPDMLALVTKGLVPGDLPEDAPKTYDQHLEPSLTSPSGRIVGIGGPCIARELALNMPTRVSFASQDVKVANELRQQLQTENYRITTGTDLTGLEACAALKNFMCIGVSAMYSAYPLEDSHAKNPVAALFNQAVLEIAALMSWIVASAKQERPASSSDSPISNAFDLAGMGDLHVTVGGGRNSRLGQYLGKGETLDQVLQTSMLDVTVEGVDTGRRLAPGFHQACKTGELDLQRLPLTKAILDTIEHNAVFDFDFNSLPG